MAADVADYGKFSALADGPVFKQRCIGVVEDGRSLELPNEVEISTQGLHAASQFKGSGVVKRQAHGGVPLNFGKSPCGKSGTRGEGHLFLQVGPTQPDFKARQNLQIPAVELDATAVSASPSSKARPKAGTRD